MKPNGMKPGSFNSDPTAYSAVGHVNKKNKRQERLIRHILGLCDLSGYKVVGRIVLEDKNTGEIFK